MQLEEDNDDEKENSERMDLFLGIINLILTATSKFQHFLYKNKELDSNGKRLQNDLGCDLPFKQQK